MTLKITITCDHWDNLTRYQRYRLKKLTIYKGAMKLWAEERTPAVWLARTSRRKTIGWVAYVEKNNEAMIYVLPEYRGCGIAKQLFNSMLSDVYMESGLHKPIKVFPWSDSSYKFFEQFQHFVDTSHDIEDKHIPEGYQAKIGSSHF